MLFPQNDFFQDFRWHESFLFFVSSAALQKRQENVTFSDTVNVFFMVGITLSERYGPTEFWYFVSISEIFDARSTVVSAEINPCSPKMSSTIFFVSLSFIPTLFLAHLSRRLTRWAYRMGLEPASVRPSVRPCVRPCVRPHFQTWISPRPAGRLQPNFIWSIVGVGERLH